MKKSVFAAALLLSIILALPIIGNTFIKKTIDARVLELESYGLSVRKDESRSNYFKSSRHFEFLLQDTQKFLIYLQQYSDKQIPPYVNAMFEGVVVGADVEYSNLPFAKAFEVEIYPMTLSRKMGEDLKKNDLTIYKKLNDFLGIKGLLYHIEYNLINEDFKGYIKDIEEKLLFNDGVDLEIVLEDANFKGNGALIAPNELHSKIKNLQLQLHQDVKEITLHCKDLATSMNFESANTYVTSAEMEHMDISLLGVSDDINLTMQKLRINSSSNAQSQSIELNSKSSIKSFEIHSKTSDFMMKKFNFDMAINDLDKELYTKLVELLSEEKAMVSQQSNTALQTTLIKLLSKGLLLHIGDFSVDSFSKDKQEFLDGFTVNAAVTIKEDKDLAQKIKISPLMAITDVALESEVRISKALYAKLQANNMMLARLQGYEKDDGDAYLFVLQFVDGKASINGRVLN